MPVLSEPGEVDTRGHALEPTMDATLEPTLAPTVRFDPALPLKILGLGRALPARVVTSADLETRLGLPSGWIWEKQGIRERRWVADETASSLGAEAAREALAQAGIPPSSLDGLINASGTPEQAIPDGACLIQRALGLERSSLACFSVHATCLSFLLALDLASSLLATGRYRTLLIVSADITSCALDFRHVETFTLFGDGAAAAVVTRTPVGEASGILACRLETYSLGADFTRVEGCGTRKHPSRAQALPEEGLFHMEGLKVYRLARARMPGFLERLWPGITRDCAELSLIVPHQASKLALDALSLAPLPQDRVVRTLERTGNCVAASLPLTLYEAHRSGRLQRGMRVLLLGTGAGLTLGGMVLDY